MREKTWRAMWSSARRRGWTALVLAAAGVGVVLLNHAPVRGATALAKSPVASPGVPAAARAAREELTERAWIRRTLAHMTLAEEVGQLFEINGYGESVRDPNPTMIALNRKYYGVENIAQLIEKYHPGGIIYFNWSNGLTQPSQVVDLSNGIQRVALAQRTPVPMLISTDQEYGEVLRVGSPATVFPGNMPLGATRNTGYARAAGRIGGEELRAMGINVDNAPVVDVNINPLNQADGIRAYGDYIPLVSILGAQQVKGYQTEQKSTGVGATAKHWPGFGDAPVNSDTGVAVSPQTLAEVKRDNLPPFRAAIKAGIDRIMVTHILFPKITGNKVPTSLSPFWINGLLRSYLHYNGPVVTDALDAAALNSFSPEEVALRALKAGVDQLLEVAQTPSDSAPADLVKAYPAVLTAVRTHAIAKRRLDESVARILELKWKLGLVKHAITNPERVTRVVGTPRHLAAAQKFADHSITVLKNDQHLLPLKVPTTTKVLVTGFGQTTTTTLANDIASRGLTAQALPTGSNPTSDDIAKALAAAGQSDLVVVTTFNAWGGTSQIELVNELLGLGKPVVVVAVGTPYDVAYVPDAPTFIASYGYQAVTINSLVKVMFGDLEPTGRLPVTITEPPPSTKVLFPFGYRLPLAPP